jgi:hypothetical protein
MAAAVGLVVMRISPRALEHDARRRGLTFRTLAGVEKFAVIQPSGTTTRFKSLEAAQGFIWAWPIRATYNPW